MSKPTRKSNTERRRALKLLAINADGCVRKLDAARASRVLVVMPTSKEYRQRAEGCLRLASTAEDSYGKTALAELAADFTKMAESLDAKTIHTDRTLSRPLL
jgi:hypothetical protein